MIEVAESMRSTVDWLKNDKFGKMIDSIIEQVQQHFECKNLPKTSIYNVPSKLYTKDVNSPHFVSIGPIHSGRADLLAMEEMKLWYSMFFFNRSSEDMRKNIQDSGVAIINIIKQAREYYAHDLTKFNKYKLTKILLVDGCFLLELFLKNSDKRQYNQAIINMCQPESMTTSDDLILGNPWMRSAVCKDLVLLENQIPLVVLEKLFSLIKTSLKSSNGVKDYTLRFFGLNLNAGNATSTSTDMESKPSEEPRPSQEPMPPKGICFSGSTIARKMLLHWRGTRSDPSPVSKNEEKPSPSEEPRHILEMLHKSLLPSQPLQNGEKKYRLEFCATMLVESGINIEKKLDLSSETTDDFNSHLLEIEFDRGKGILKIPQFWIGGTTSLITKNLVAFEQCSFGRSQSRHVTAYVIFMKSLLCSKRDIKLLKRKGIIHKQPGSGTDKSAAVEFFDDCCKLGVAMKDFYFSKVCEEVEDYSKKWMHFHSYVTRIRSRRSKYVAVLARRYCPDACRAIAFCAATTLLILTFLQTFFTIYPYYHKR